MKSKNNSNNDVINREEAFFGKVGITFLFTSIQISMLHDIGVHKEPSLSDKVL